MLVEVPWMQRFVLYLDHPSYATTIVLTNLLLGAGIGSSVAARIDRRAIKWWSLLVPNLLLVTNFVLFGLFETTLDLSFFARVIISAAVLVPTGFLIEF